ncbi:MAG: polyphosphate polymerase domain-containing protein [Flavobacteriales bacterium]
MPPRYRHMKELDILQRFAPIKLAEMDAVQLQFRMDTKYVFGAHRLNGLLEELLPEYRLLEVNGSRGIDYETRYFDTNTLSHYFDHHNGKPLRTKIRVRRYGGSGLCVLEVKRKTGRGGTDKRRTPLQEFPERLAGEHQAFAIQHSHSTGHLGPVLGNTFHRLTLVHRERLERLTIDMDIAFSLQGTAKEMPGLCVAELKEGRTGHGSPFSAIMRRWAVPPVSFSKYCVGTALMHPDIKRNTFKPVLLQAARAAIPATAT